MPTVKLSPIFNDQVVDENGAPAAGWQLFTYAATSSTPQATYTTVAGDVPQPNPIVFDALGFSTLGPIWLASGVLYKMVLTDANGVVKKTFDSIAGTNDSTSTASQWIPSGATPIYISGTSFSVPGDQTSEFHVGRREQFSTGAGTLYGTIIKSVYNGTTLTTVTVQMDSGVLDNGLTAVNHGLLRADNSSVPEYATEMISGFSGLTGSSDATTPTTKFNLAADVVVTRNALGRARTYFNVASKTVDITLASQLGGRDQAAAFSALAEPNIFFVPDGNGGLGLVASLANGTTSGPVGYSEWALAVNSKLNGSSQFVQGNVTGNYFQLTAVSSVVSGSGGFFPTSSSYSTLCPALALEAFFTSKVIAGTNAGGGGSVIPLIGMGSNILDNCDIFINTANGSGSTPLKARLPVGASGRSITYGQSNAAGNLASYAQTVYLTGYTMRNGAR